MRKFIFILLCISIKSAFPKDKVVGIVYFDQIFGQVHSAPLSSSSSLTTISCGHPIKLLHNQKIKVKDEWKYVKVGSHKGYVLAEFLNNKRKSCFQAKYPKFFSSLEIDLKDLYYWGRLYDQYITGKSKVNSQ